MTAPAPDPPSRPRILLAEDDARLAGAFARRLGADHLDVDVVGSVAEARAHERRIPYACLVLDRLLPDGDVLELVREIDERPNHPPIVLVSAVADQDDRLEGLRAGADDYVGKPVHLEELAARVTRLVGGTAGADLGQEAPVELGPLRLDPVRLRVHLDDEPLVLPVPQLVILRTLVLHGDRAVPADELVDACVGHGAGPISATSLAGHIAALERALEGHLTIERAPRRAFRIRVGAGVPDSLPRRLIRRAARALGRPEPATVS